MTTTLDEPRFPAEPPARPRGPWYRRRGTVVTAAVLAVLAVAVVTDLPTPTSRSSDVGAAKTVVNQLNQDVKTCAYSVREAFTIYVAATHGTLTAAQRSGSTKLLSQDQLACSFYAENSTMYDLSTIDAPSTASGRRLHELIDTATIWATGDALGSIEAIQTLMTAPSDAHARASLDHYARLLESDRVAALAAVTQIEDLLGAPLPRLELPEVSESGAGLLAP